MVILPFLTVMTSVMAQNTVYIGQSKSLGVTEVPGDTYVWELYNDITAINFATDPGNCPSGDAYFIGSSTGPAVNVMWLTQGIYYYKVTAHRDGCTMNLKIGMITVLDAMPSAVIDSTQPICAGDSVHLTVRLTGTAPWNITLTDGLNNVVYNNITSSPYTLTVPAIPTATASYWIMEVTDAYLTNTTPSSQVVQMVNPKPINSRIYQYGP